jgi:hypothetical protein
MRLKIIFDAVQKALRLPRDFFCILSGSKNFSRVVVTFFSKADLKGKVEPKNFTPMERILYELPTIVITIVLFIAAAIIIYKFIHLKHKERMALIEKGFDLTKNVSEKSTKHIAARNGILLISIGVGLFIGGGGGFDFWTSLGLVALFGGLGFVIYYQKVLKRMDNREE